jgi:hypothetical protein
MTIQSKCPYCGCVNNNNAELIPKVHRKIVVTCDSDEGGCDKIYVASAALKVECEVFKIEGQERICRGNKEDITDAKQA